MLMEFGWLTSFSFNMDFLSSFISIIIIDIILSGDNAVLIALAVRSLPRDQRQKAIYIGSGAAVLLRIVLTFFAIQLLAIPYLKLIGGMMIIWIAVKLFLEDAADHNDINGSDSLLKAIKVILVADFVMSLDNVIAVAAASKGSMLLIVFGLILSIPLVVGTSTFLLKMIDRYPVIIMIGAAVLGKVGGEMIITDPVVVRYLGPGKLFTYGFEVTCIVGVIIAGKTLVRWKIRKEEAELGLQSQ
jgi:YjbE family integral membrane protein